MPPNKQKPPSSRPKKPKRESLRGSREGLKISYAIGDAKTHLSEIVEQIEATGTEVVVTRHGKPVARLVPERGSGPRPLGFARGTVTLKQGWDQPLTYEDLFGGE